MYTPVKERYPNKKLLVKTVEMMIGVYFGNRLFQKQTLGEFIAENLLDTTPEHMAFLLKDDGEMKADNDKFISGV